MVDPISRHPIGFDPSRPLSAGTDHNPQAPRLWENFLQHSGHGAYTSSDTQRRFPSGVVTVHSPFPPNARHNPITHQATVRSAVPVIGE